MELNSNGSDLIRVLEFPECVRAKHGMYLSSPTDMLRECIDNSTDEVLACKTCNLIIVDTNFDGYNLVCDQGRGIPIFLSPDKPGRTQADVAVSTLHAGSKFVNQDSKIGTYGIGVSATNALSSHFWILSKITQENYDKSIPEVKSFYESLGPRSRKEIFYFAYFEKGIKVSEGAAKKSDLESMMGLHKQLPEGMSTMTLFIVDPEIFPSQRVEIPIENLENFLFIQEKFYRRKIQVIANGQVLTSASIKPYQFEILRTITPADISKNPYIGVYVTFEVDASLAPKKTAGSVNGLVVNNGVHIQYLESCFEAALREEYKIKHKTIFPGLKMWVIVLAEDLVYDSQIKSRLRSISKVKATDFQEITKDFIKIFRKNEDYWLAHVNKLNALAESYRSIGAIEKAQKMIDSATGNNAFRSKQEYVEGFADATSHDRWNCELLISEGLSAAGGLKAGRKSTLYHAVLPLRGKVLNVKDASVDEALANKEIFTLLKVIGLGIDANNVTSDCKTREEAYEKIKKYSRYGKICIATDEDPDGDHIRILLLYLIAKYARFLVDFGLVYIAQSPLYAQDGKYFYSNDPLQPGTPFPVGLDTSKKNWHRWKG